MSAISEEEIEREVRTLKNLRRRSGSAAGPGDLALDPDLPPSDAFSSSSSGTSTTYSSNDDVTLSLPTDGGDGLFWVPAHLHPELAPGEFRAFLKQHTHGDPMAVDVAGESGEASLGRSPSWLARSSSLSGGLGRKKSMLSRQYSPRAGDQVENERPPALMRRGSSVYGRRNNEQEPTLQDLQKLEEIVEGSGIGDDPEQMGALLRRTLSRNISPSMAEDGILSPEDTNAPLVVPRSGSIIRRTARTKIRKTVPGEVPRRGFGSGTRRGRATPSEEGRPSTEERRSDETTSEGPSSESRHMSGESYEDKGKQVDTSALSDDSTDEALIFDAYAGDRTSMSTTSSLSSYGGRSRSPSPDDDDTPLSEKTVPILAPIHAPKASDANWFEDEDHDLTPTQESPMSAALHAMTLLPTSGPSDDIFQATPQQQTSPTTPSRQPVAYPSSSQSQAPPPAPPKTTTTEQYLPPGMAPPCQSSAGGMSANMAAPQRNGVAPPSLVIQQPPLSRIDSGASATSTMSSKEKEKAKKGGLFSKKDKKDKDKDKSKKEKDGFLGSLFGSKKKQEEPVSLSNFATAGPAAAAALLGTSKSAKSLQHSGTSSPTSPGFSNFARYPIHVERAVYRLSHIKLANARRPLIEQVLISNLMFWYLGVIGRTAGPSEDKKKGTTNGLDQDRSAVQNTPPPKGTPAKPADTGSAGVKQPDAPSLPPSPGRAKGGLNKPERSRQPNSHPEAAYRAPQYGMQNAQMDKEMRGGGGNGGGGNGGGGGGGGGVSPVREKTSPTSPQHHAPPQPYPSQPAQQPQPRTSSIPASPARTRSPPVSPTPRQEYPPGIAPPRAPPTSSFGSPGSQARPLPPSGGGDGRESRGDSSRQQRYSANYSLPSGAAPHPHHHSTSPPPGMRQPPPQQHYAPMQNGSPRQEAQRLHPQHSGGSRQSPVGGPGRPSSTAGPQPGQIFQYPGQQYSGQQQRGGGGPQPGQIFNAQPGQIFHHPQFQQQQQQGQRPGPPQPNWESPQRLPQQQHPGPALAQAPPRRSSSNSGHGHDPYRPNPGYQPGGQTSPTHQSFYGGGGPGGGVASRPPSMQPGQQYGYAPAGGQPRQQTVSPVQYPHHR